jgi:uncharacterized repeat protein (TIGR01451 family)
VVPYTFTVTNIGNVTMTGLGVSDPKVGPITCPATTLSPGVAMTCTASLTVSQGDLDQGEVVNQADVVGTPPVGGPVSSSSNLITIPVAQTKSLSLVKSSSTTTMPAVGETIPYTFLVTNTGNVTITGIILSDSNAAGISCQNTALVPMAAMTCTGMHVVTQADVDDGGVVNTATVTGTPPSGTPIPPMPSNTVTIPGDPNPQLSIVKSTTSRHADSVGQLIPFLFSVTNTGNVTITGIVVADPKIPVVSCPQNSLGTAESMTCTGSYTVTPADIADGQVRNTATVAGTSPGGTPIAPVPSNEVLVPVPPTASPVSLRALASTGGNIAAILQMALFSMVLGGGLVAIARRRLRRTS